MQVDAWSTVVVVAVVVTVVTVKVLKVTVLVTCVSRQMQTDLM